MRYGLLQCRRRGVDNHFRVTGTLRGRDARRRLQVDSEIGRRVRGFFIVQHVQSVGGCLRGVHVVLRRDELVASGVGIFHGKRPGEHEIPARSGRRMSGDAADGLDESESGRYALSGPVDESE